jgi:hypothetical protein
MNTLTNPELSAQSLLSSNSTENASKLKSPVAFTPSSDDIAYRAFLNYQNHGSADGHDFQDWLRAEAELIAEQKYESPKH